MNRIILIGCGKAKKKEQREFAAEFLYTSNLFKARRQYAQNSRQMWWIVSGMHGLLHPHENIEPYDFTLSDYPPDVQLEWGSMVSSNLRELLNHLLRQPARPPIELHMGRAYRVPLVEHLESWADVLLPLEGLDLVGQMSWYKERRES